MDPLQYPVGNSALPCLAGTRYGNFCDDRIKQGIFVEHCMLEFGVGSGLRVPELGYVFAVQANPDSGTRCTAFRAHKI